MRKSAFLEELLGGETDIPPSRLKNKRAFCPRSSAPITSAFSLQTSAFLETVRKSAAQANREGLVSASLAALEMLQHRFGAVMDPELVVNVLQVVVNGPDADPQQLCDLLVDVPAADQVENLPLPIG